MEKNNFIQGAKEISPYILPSDEPSLISFSGGRSSAYMLYQILQANSGLPKNAFVVFANTGREMPETLDFVRNCQREWDVEIVWLEHKYDGKKSSFNVVNYASASRNGEPFERLINRRKFLPNVVRRYCTQDLKIRTMQRYMRKVHGINSYLNYIGIRGDEPRRIAKTRALNESEKLRPCVIPMAEMGVTKEIVGRFWRDNAFDLALENVNGTTPLGNCDLCFLKGVSKISSLIRDYPDRARWWLDMEDKSLASYKQAGGQKGNATFIKNTPYKLLSGYKNKSLLDFDDSIQCIGCTD